MHLAWLLTRELPKEVQVQLLQSANMLVHNLSNLETLSDFYAGYLINTSFYKQIISVNFDFYDLDIIENYIALLKGLAVNLPAKVLQSFLEANDFSLFKGAKRFLFFEETMVRTSARTTTLKVMKLKEKETVGFILSSNFIQDVIEGFREKLLLLDQSLNSVISISRLESLVSDEIDTLFYLNDIISEEIPELSHRVANSFLGRLVFPMIIGSLTNEPYQTAHLSIPVSCYFLASILQNVKHPLVVNLILSTLFPKETRQDLLELISEESDADFIKIAQEIVNDGSEKYCEMKKNPAREVLMGFLRSKDEKMITLTLLIIQNAMKNRASHKKVLELSGLNPVSKGNTNLETNGQPYNKEMVNLLIESMKADPPFRKVTNQLLVNTLMALTYHENVEECLTPEDRTGLDHAMLRVLNSLQELIQTRYFDDLIIECFEESGRAINFNEKVPCMSYFLVPIIDDFIAEVPLEHRHPYGNIDLIRCEITLFFMYREVWNLLCKGQQNQESQSNGSQGNRSLNSWKQGKSYTFEDKCLVRCYLDDSLRFFVEDSDSFIMAKPDLNTPGAYIVIHATDLRNVEVMIHKMNLYSLVVTIKSKFDSSQIYLIFESQQNCIETKRVVEQHRKISMDNYIDHLQQYLQELKTSLSQ